VLTSDDRFRLPIAAVRASIADDRLHGLQPFCVVANAGTTSTAAVDFIEELAALSRVENLWLHVDGAYGASAALQVKWLKRQISHADSLALDPHKWLFQPLEHLNSGCRCRYLASTQFALQSRVALR
jgi:glutamate/tyrosine decarboxylase-like PLP-dependent enzyme